MPNSENIVNALLKVKQEENGHVVYHYPDGTFNRQPINKAVFFDERNKELDLSKVVQLFNDTCHDKGAQSYEIE